MPDQPEKPPPPQTTKPPDVVGLADAMTPSHGIATPPYVERKVKEAKEQVVEEAKKAAHDEAATTATATTLAQVFRTRLFVLLTTGSIGGMTLGGVAYAFETLRDKARDAGSESAKNVVKDLQADVKGLEARQTVTEAQIPELRAEVSRLREETYQQRLESRDVYRAVIEGKRSERMENPPPKPEPIIITKPVPIPIVVHPAPTKDGG